MTAAEESGVKKCSLVIVLQYAPRIVGYEETLVRQERLQQPGPLGSFNFSGCTHRWHHHHKAVGARHSDLPSCK